MNKAERHRRKMLKFRSRLTLYGFTLEDSKKPNYNLHAFRSHGKPCSCSMCKGESYSRKIKHKLLL